RDTFQTAQDNPPETLQTLFTYKKRFGQAQRFLNTVPCMGTNFRWSSSIPEYLRRNVFENITDIDFEFDDKVGFNLLFFYNALDSGEFSEHKNEWMTIHKQRVIEYGQKYDDDKLNCILETMPGAVQIPVNQKRLPRNLLAKIVIVQRAENGNDYKFRVHVKRPWEGLITLLEYDFYDIQNNNKKECLGEQAEARARVQAKIVVWEKDPGNQVEYALVGNDVAYAREPRKSIKFLDLQDEPNLTQFLMGCA
ncbi:10895_t:CDS:2, partial [Acaulospora morrowiae]